MFLNTFGLSVELVGNERKTFVANAIRGWFAVGEALVSMLYNFSSSSLMKMPNKLEHLSPASPPSLIYHLKIRLEPTQAGLAQACFLV
jgi:hypothetical protein